jgi:hypothetical protein
MRVSSASASISRLVSSVRTVELVLLEELAPASVPEFG